ncbi:hypothetical protein NX794_29140 [Streptomyces sp. LP11]|uniref:Uncharacterized protein n=1 Tax=Streptomyces pyxinicus TaxID=2970331 RepID=A0ABT2B9R3_9ACTN|nr:DUF6578 domain-containing protein [Streptomyces sp. LP11]MCS0605245.1 hypothetical protein [Streptomyces sp. LP11]
MPRMRVFYESWQVECCGTPFAVGDEVTWRLVAVEPDRRGGEFYGGEAWVNQHGGMDGKTTGRVCAIEVVWQEHLAHHDPLTVEHPEPAPGPLVIRAAGQTLEAVPGGTVLESVTACPRWFGETEEQPPRRVPFRVRRGEGVLVTLDVSAGGPCRAGDRR